MRSYNFGDILLIGFPHTDLQGISKRPAIVLHDSGDQDVLLARITTQEYTTETDYRILDWQKVVFLQSRIFDLANRPQLKNDL